MVQMAYRGKQDACCEAAARRVQAGAQRADDITLGPLEAAS
jgi:hypothetical protein